MWQIWLGIWLILVASLAYLLKPKKAYGQLQKEDFARDVVYLVQFPVSPFIRSISPFALKLETYLRLKKVRYEPVYSLHFGRKRQIPYIELNGEHIPDSNVIINELEKRGISKPDGSDPDQNAVYHLATVALENHTCLAGFLWRYGYHMTEFYEALCKETYGSSRALFFFRNVQPFAMKMKGRFHGLGRHSLEEIAEFSFKDLKALSTLLSGKPFFRGETPSTFDCTAFGHLAQFVYLPMNIPQKRFINEHCHNLVTFCDRMKATFWPDWEEMCQKACMDGKTATSIIK